MSHTLITILSMLLAMLTSLVVFPWALRYAREHGIVDNPNARKLQRRPVPVFGGVVVYSGILVGGLFMAILQDNTNVLWGLLAMGLMMVIGTWDDMRDLPAGLRFLIEMVLVGSFMALTGLYIDDLHGLWGISELDPMIGLPFSVISGVGIINAINMIDGVDGYSSGYGMMACGFFAIAFWSVWSPVQVCLAMLGIAALFPFFLHNVFGQRSRMFIGDGGTMMLGMLLVMLVFSTLSSKSPIGHLEDQGMSVPGFVLAVGCIPLFDTLRVMFARIMRGKSPFKPDKTHLHHLFIDMGFSHLGAALFILLLNAVVVGLFYLSWRLGLSIDAQTYVSIGLGILVTIVFYKFMKIQQNYGPEDEEGYPQGTFIWHRMCELGRFSHRENKRFWRIIRHFVDGPLLGGGGGRMPCRGKIN